VGVGLAAFGISWWGHEIPRKPLLREHQHEVLLLRANDLVFRAFRLAATSPNAGLPAILAVGGPWRITPGRVRSSGYRPSLNREDVFAAVLPAIYPSRAKRNRQRLASHARRLSDNERGLATTLTKNPVRNTNRTGESKERRKRMNMTLRSVTREPYHLTGAGQPLSPGWDRLFCARK